MAPMGFEYEMYEYLQLLISLVVTVWMGIEVMGVYIKTLSTAVFPTMGISIG